MEDFVPFEIAKKLKEKGFDKYCCRAYNEIGCFNDTDTYKYSGEFYCYAPQISQVLKWLREEKDLFVCIEFFNYEIGFGYKLVRLDYVDTITENQYHKTYEKAAIAGIEYCLDNLI